MELPWTFRCYVNDQGIDVIDAWRELQPPELQATFDERIRYLRYQPREQWVRPYFDTLGRECKGWGEIRFKHKRIQYRPLGFFDGEGVFTLVLVATKTDKFDPKNACEIGLRRKAEIESDRSKANDCDME